MKRVVIVCSSYELGGVESSLKQLMETCLCGQYDVELHLLVQDSKDSIVPLVPDDVKVRILSSHYRELFKNSPFRNAIEMIKNKGFIHTAKRIWISILMRLGINRIELLSQEMFPDAQKIDCAVCIIAKENEEDVFYALSMLNTNNRIAYFHTAKYFNPEFSSIYESSRINNIVTVSKGNMNYLCGKMPKIRNKIHVIHNIIDIEKVCSMADMQLTIPEKKEGIFCILSVGRISQEKGIDIMLQAAKCLVEFDVCFQWLMVGPFSKQYTYEEFSEKIEKNGLVEYVKWCGSTQNPYPYFRVADIIVNASQIESFGMVIREAQILGVPVIATDTFGSNELIVDGKSGFIVPVDNSNALAEKIRLLIQNPQQLCKVKEELVHMDFDEAEDIKKQIIDLIG